MSAGCGFVRSRRRIPVEAAFDLKTRRASDQKCNSLVLPAAEVAVVAVLIDAQRTGEDGVFMILIIVKLYPIQHLRRSDLEELVVAIQHVELLAPVGVGRTDEHRPGGGEHRITERFDDRAERG